MSRAVFRLLLLLLITLPSSAWGQDYVYWTQGPMLRRMPIPSGPVQEIYEHNSTLEHVAIDAARSMALLTVNGQGPYVLVINSGSPATPLSDDATALEIDRQAGLVYWTDSSGVLLRTSYPQAGSLTGLTPDAAGALDLTLDAATGQIYWLTSDSIKRFDTIHGGVQTVTTNVNGASGIFAKNNQLYWVMNGNVYQASAAAVPITGSSMQTYWSYPHPLVGDIAPGPMVNGRLSFMLPSTNNNEMARAWWNGVDYSFQFTSAPDASQIKGAATDLSCRPGDRDSDGDGIPDCADECPDDGLKSAPGACGCGIADSDGDGDGVPDCLDECPSDPGKTVPGSCGCGIADSDGDGDGVPDCFDECPGDPAKTAPGSCGCGAADSDRDSDGVPDCLDECASDPEKTVPGSCGCGTADSDRDSDGVPDCHDGCPQDAEKQTPGVCGCGRSDVDADASGIADCADLVQPDGIATPGTVPAIPEVEVKARTVTVLLERFSGAALQGKKPKLPKKLSVSYQVVVRPLGRATLLQTTARSKAIQLIQRRNRVVLRNMAPGAYAVNYRVRIMNGQKTVASSRWSPSARFTVS